MRPLIFRMQPETAHHVTLALLRMGGAVAPARGLLSAAFRPTAADRTVQAFGLTFPNAVGLAAGYDKDGLGWRGLAALGFGHIEVGTVTPRPQAGNPGPRVFRLVEDRAVINRMGFPNRGAEFVARRLGGKRPAGLILGVNIGKNLTTSLEHAAEDYLSLVKTFAPARRLPDDQRELAEHAWAALPANPQCAGGPPPPPGCRAAGAVAAFGPARAAPGQARARSDVR